jgi:ketosteroid isomerase-like protein
MAMWGSATETQKLSLTEQEVVNVNKARMEAAANRDMAAWTRYVAEDCLFSTDGGTVSTKAQMLAHYKKVPAMLDRALDPREQVVHLYGDTAILNYLATLITNSSAIATSRLNSVEPKLLSSVTALGC